MDFIGPALVVLLIGALIYLNRENKRLSIQNSKATDNLKEIYSELVNTQDELGGEREKNRALLSQKKSSETRLGQISEHLVPFLDKCPYNPKDLHFLGNPIDYVIFDFDQGAITFLEIKSGNSKPSKRQKLVRNIVRSGRVFYDEIRINEKGVKLKQVKNLDPNPVTDLELDLEQEDDDNVAED
jgi:predicted Holliday junction resolvase-like endonuclease